MWSFCPLAPEAAWVSGPGAQPGPIPLHSATTGIPVIMGLISSPPWRRGQSRATPLGLCSEDGQVFRGWGPAVRGTLSSFPEAKGGPPLSTCHTGPQRAKTPRRERRGRRGAASLLVSALHLLCPTQWLLQTPPCIRSPRIPFHQGRRRSWSRPGLLESFITMGNSQSSEMRWW